MAKLAVADAVPGRFERAGDGVQDGPVRDRVPAAFGRRGGDGLQFLLGAEPAPGVEHEVGHETVTLWCEEAVRLRCAGACRRLRPVKRGHNERGGRRAGVVDFDPAVGRKGG